MGGGAVAGGDVDGGGFRSVDGVDEVSVVDADGLAAGGFDWGG